MQRDLMKDLRRILAVRLDNIGDVVMLGPALQALRMHYPTAEITLLASPSGAQTAPLLPWIDRFIEHRPVWQDASDSMAFDPIREERFIEALRQRAFEAAFLFTSFSQSCYPPAYAAYLAGIPVRIGQAADFGGSVLTDCVKPLPVAAHQVDRNLHLLESVGLPAVERKLRLVVPPEAEASIDQILRGFAIKEQERFILLAPGASCAARRYDLNRFVAVLEQLIHETNLPVVICGHQSEQKSFEPLMKLSGKIISLVGKITISELAAVIRRTALLIGNDSGPMHIADAFHRPMVILFSGTDLESQWRPRNSPAILLRQPTYCFPCYRFQCPYNMECLDISPHQVVRAACALLRDEAFAEEQETSISIIRTNKEEDTNPCAPYVC
jgi:ADP-heptose:LPS heptosyltransferase